MGSLPLLTISAMKSREISNDEKIHEDSDDCNSTRVVVRARSAPAVVQHADEEQTANQRSKQIIMNTQHVTSGNPMEAIQCLQRATSNQACRYYLKGVSKGKCRAGLNCKDKHSTAGKCIRCYAVQTQENMEDHIKGGCPKNLLPSGLMGDLRRGICENFKSGCCQLGRTCPLSHSDRNNRCLLCHKQFEEGDVEKHLNTNCSEWKNLQLELLSSSEDSRCPICFREFQNRHPKKMLNDRGKINVVETLTPARQANDVSDTFSTFAILPNCSHACCMNCILKWRDGQHRRSNRHEFNRIIWNGRRSIGGRGDQQQQQQQQQQPSNNREDEIEAKYRCPVCRADAPFVVPVNRIVRDPERRKREVARYFRRLKKIKCRYFFANNKICKYGDSCFFRHNY